MAEMSILDKFRGGDLRERRPSSIEPFVMVDCNQVDPNEIGSMSHKFGFFLEARLRVEFFANKAQYHDARRNAEKQILALLYDGIRVPLLRARAAIFAGDAEGALKELSSMEKEIGL